MVSQSTPDTSSRKSLFSSENRILLIVIGAISLAFIIVAFGLFYNYRANLSANYDKFASMMTSVIAAGAQERMASPLSPELRLQTFADTMIESSQDIASIEFVDAANNVVYETHQKEAAPQHFQYSAPIRREMGGQTVTLGTVYVEFTGRTLNEIQSATSHIIWWVFMPAYLISVLAVLSNTYILSKHLRTFVRGVKRLSTGDFGYKILEQDLWGELKVLARSFNDMSMRLRAYEDQNLDTITFERNKLKAILLSIADGVVVCDHNGKITIINDAACDLLGFKTSAWAISTNIREYVTVEGARCFDPLIDQFNQHLNNPEAVLSDFSRTIEMPDITLKVIISPIMDADGETLGFVMIMHDITKEHEVDKLKTNFISNVSHELRTPVTTIKSYVDTIYNHGRELDSETYDEFIETINIETDRLKKLVNDILDFSRLDEGNLPLEKEYVEIAPVINLTVQSIKVLAEQKNLSLSTTIESNLPKVFINSDSIERVLRNLLSNAIKYTPDNGRIKVRAEVTEDGDWLEISVQDTGVGIGEEHLPYLFDRFYRVENKVHTVKGTGLGLHLVKIAIEKHHDGEVFVKSDVGQGSTFGFRLPLHVEAELAEQSAPTAGLDEDLVM